MEADPLALSRQHPEWSAGQTLSGGQQLALAMLLLAGLAALWFAPWTAAAAAVALATLFYLVFTLYKLYLLRLSVSGSAALAPGPEELAALRPDDLPHYSIMVPMYHEAASLPHLLRALRALDYPREKLDVQLLLEEDDAETRTAAAALDLPPWCRITLIPPSHPRTKPKACNIGLARARGELVVIYDAEDRPEPDQLKKAVAAFRQVGPEVVCLQGKLNFYNPRHNLLTRWFTAEYSAWFDLSLPGLSQLRTVIPLGGTSNHFRTAVLRDLLGWDAWNVTEDCDLGVRILRRGYATRMIETTTWEEACSSLPFWIRQRTRWLKGYMQTYLVHTRGFGRLTREIGLVHALHFHLLIGGVIACFLLNPVFWILVGLWFAFRSEILASLFAGPIFAMGAFCLFAGNFTFVYAAALGCFHRKYFDLVKYTLITPVYWVMMSLAGWRALFQLITNPFTWEKTRHGLS